MLVAVFLVHGPNGFGVTKGGHEYALALGVIAVLFGLAAPARIRSTPRSGSPR